MIPSFPHWYYPFFPYFQLYLSSFHYLLYISSFYRPIIITLSPFSSSFIINSAIIIYLPSSPSLASSLFLHRRSQRSSSHFHAVTISRLKVGEQYCHRVSIIFSLSPSSLLFYHFLLQSIPYHLFHRSLHYLFSIIVYSL